MEKTHLTLYTTIGAPERIPEAAEKLFAPVIKAVNRDGNRTTLILQDDTPITFTLSHVKNKAEFIEMHTAGMADYFARTETILTDIKEKVLQQIRMFNCVTGIVFETDDNNERTRYIINTLFDLANEVNAFLLYPDMHIYNSKGKLVFSKEGESELEDFMPVVNTDMFAPEEQTEADIRRRERSIAILEEQKIPYIRHLPCEISESKARIKSREEMVQRAATLFAVAVYSEVMLSENPDLQEARSYFNKMDEIYGIHQWMTSAETNYILNPEASEQERIQFVWRYENCAVLLWAAGIVEELPYPSEISDVPVIAAIFWQHKSIEDLLSEGSARSDGELLDAADLSLRYDWACINARIHQQETPGNLDGGIVMERHYTFNWITGAGDNAGWDDNYCSNP